MLYKISNIIQVNYARNFKIADYYSYLLKVFNLKKQIILLQTEGPLIWHSLAIHVY